MTAQAFANFAKTAPAPCTTLHTGAGGATPYTCHMAVMHWAFMDLGDSHAIANMRVTAINNAKCLGCSGLHFMHGSINPNWYGLNFCLGGVHIPNRAALYGAVNVGDVLILPRPAAPMHSMVVVKKSTTLGRHYVYIRGFNNFGTTGTGVFLQYDNANRDIDRASLWRPAPPVFPPVVGAEVFGNGGAELFCIPYANYIANAGIVRNNCNGHLGYIGP